MKIAPNGDTIAGVSHHVAKVNGTEIHYVAAGTFGTPVLLMHGFPESWWAFHRVIPLLAAHHRVFAPDLRGFGDSASCGLTDTSATIADDMQALMAKIGIGPMHVLAQDISGSAALRLIVANRPNLKSFIGIETGFAGFGLEALANVAHGGAWYIGLLATPGAAEAFLSGRERALIEDFIMPAATARPDTLTSQDIGEFVRGYAKPGGWSGANTLYASMLQEGDEIKALAKDLTTDLPMLAVDRLGSDFTKKSLAAVFGNSIRHAQVSNTGHYIALEAAPELSTTLLSFLSDVDDQST